MRGFVPLLLLAALALPNASATTVTTGVVPAGSGAALVPGVDHARHAVPAGAIGLVLQPLAEPRGEPQFALLAASCPPIAPCAQVVSPACLAVYAKAGAVDTRYAFSWAFAPEDGMIALGDLAVLPRVAPDHVCELPTPGPAR